MLRTLPPLPTLPTLLLGFLLAASTRMVTAAPAEIIIVVGAGGKDEYAQEFAASAELWVESATSDGKKVTRIGPPQGKAKDAPEDREVLSKAIATAAEEKESPPSHARKQMSGTGSRMSGTRMTAICGEWSTTHAKTSMKITAVTTNAVQTILERGAMVDFARTRTLDVA